jgi:type IV secretory pathway VirB10-like protein
VFESQAAKRIVLLLGFALGLAACQSTESVKPPADVPTDGKGVEAGKSESGKLPKKPPVPQARTEAETDPPVEQKSAAEEKPPVPEPAALSDQQIDQLLTERRITFERAAKLRYREAVRAGRVKTKDDHTYWSTVIEIYRNWDNRYISWEDVERRLQAAQAAWRGP